MHRLLQRAHQSTCPPRALPCQQDVQLQNAGAWANLTAAPAAAAPGAAAPAAPAAGAGGAAEGAAGGEDDHLWSEFQGREQQQLQVGEGGGPQWAVSLQNGCSAG